MKEGEKMKEEEWTEKNRVNFGRGNSEGKIMTERDEGEREGR